MKKSIKIEALLTIDVAIALSLIVSVILEMISFPNVNPLLLFVASCITFILVIVIYGLVMFYKYKRWFN